MPSPVRRLTEAAAARAVAPLREQLAVERGNNELLTESVADLERQLNDPGWVRFAAFAEQEFTPEGLVQLRAICRLYAIKSALIKRGLGLRSAYVHGQGSEITARANGKEAGEQDVQAVVQRFLNDPGNVRSFTGPQARNACEHALGTDGELFIALFTAPRTGRVQVRTIPADEIVDIVSNPEDASEPWFYRRRWQHKTYGTDGTPLYELREQLYPCVDYTPPRKPQRWIGLPVDWSAPVLHVAVNRPLHWQRGIPDAYAAVDWARAYKIFLEDWATLVKSLSRFAWKLTTKGSGRAQAKAKLGTRPPTDPATGKAQDVGATAITPMDAVLEAIPKTGATIDSESGRPLAAMVAAALGVPVTMLLGDPGTTGNRATAETLDRPTELEMGQRRDLWTGVDRRVTQYVITEAVRAPQGPLKGTVTRDMYTDAEQVTLVGDTSTEVDVTWPDLDDVPTKEQVEAIVAAAGPGVIPPEQVLRLLLTALRVRHVDELVEALVDDDGEFAWPRAPAIGGPQQAALARAGGDPAQIGPGPMAGDDPDDTDDDAEADELAEAQPLGRR
jgi:hypothetical protein